MLPICVNNYDSFSKLGSFLIRFILNNEYQRTQLLKTNPSPIRRRRRGVGSKMETKMNTTNETLHSTECDYCEVCGTPLKKEEEDALLCGECDEAHYGDETDSEEEEESEKEETWEEEMDRLEKTDPEEFQRRMDRINYILKRQEELRRHRQ